MSNFFNVMKNSKLLKGLLVILPFVSITSETEAAAVSKKTTQTQTRSLHRGRLQAIKKTEAGTFKKLGSVRAGLRVGVTKKIPSISARASLFKTFRRAATLNKAPVRGRTAVFNKTQPVSARTAVLNKTQPVSTRTAVLNKTQPVSTRAAAFNKTQPVSTRAAGFNKTQPVSTRTAAFNTSRRAAILNKAPVRTRNNYNAGTAQTESAPNMNTMLATVDKFLNFLMQKEIVSNNKTLKNKEAAAMDSHTITKINKILQYIKEDKKTKSKVTGKRISPTIKTSTNNVFSNTTDSAPVMSQEEINTAIAQKARIEGKSIDEITANLAQRAKIEGKSISELLKFFNKTDENTSGNNSERGLRTGVSSIIQTLTNDLNKSTTDSASVKPQVGRLQLPTMQEDKPVQLTPEEQTPKKIPTPPNAKGSNIPTPPNAKGGNIPTPPNAKGSNIPTPPNAKGSNIPTPPNAKGSNIPTPPNAKGGNIPTPPNAKAQGNISTPPSKQANLSSFVPVSVSVNGPINLSDTLNNAMQFVDDAFTKKSKLLELLANAPTTAEQEDLLKITDELSQCIQKRIDTVDEQIDEINEKLAADNSGAKDKGVLKDEKTAIAKPYYDSKDDRWNQWSQSARKLFTKKLDLYDALITKEYSFMVLVSNERLNKLVTLNPSDRTEIETKGTELVQFIKNARSIIAKRTFDLTGPTKNQFMAIGKSLGTTQTALEQNVDVFGANAKKPSRVATRVIVKKGSEGNLLEELAGKFKK